MLNFPKTSIARLISIAFILSIALVILSCYMRLSNQGLGCNNWPDCYGYVDSARYTTELAMASVDTDVNTEQPSKYIPTTLVEQLHRIVASTLLLLVLAICLITWQRRREPGRSMALPISLLILCLFLAVLGVLFGTPLLRPMVVMANLLGGMAMMAILWWMTLTHNIESTQAVDNANPLRFLTVLGLVAVVTQTALGAWVSSNFAALACTTFPHCNGSWWPEMNFIEGFSFRQILGVDANGKIIADNAGLTSIAVMHRVGAALALLLLSWLGFKCVNAGGRLRVVGMLVLGLLLCQIMLGIAVVLLSSPLAVVVLHNTLAALLWLGTLLLVFFVSDTGAKGQRNPGI